MMNEPLFGAQIIYAEGFQGVVCVWQVAEFDRALAAVFSAGAEDRRRRREACAAALDEVFLRFQVCSYAVFVALAEGEEARMPTREFGPCPLG